MNPVYCACNTIKKSKMALDRPLNILTFPTHEAYQTLMDHTGHRFYLFNRGGSNKRWETKYRALPPNHYEINDLTYEHDFDLILSQDRFGGLQFSLDLQELLRIPIVHIEHTEPHLDKWDESEFTQLKKLHGDITLYITEHNKNSWDDPNGIVLPHGIDTKLFSGRSQEPDHVKTPTVIYIVNMLEQRDYFCGYTQWQYIKDKVQSTHPQIQFKLIGENGELGRPISNPETLVHELRSCLCYLNTSQLSPVPMSLLEAMSVGCPVVSTAKQEIPSIIKHNNNGICSNDLDLLAGSIVDIYEKPQNYHTMETQARQTIIKNFNMKQFIDSWREIFTQAYNMQIGHACILCSN